MSTTTPKIVMFNMEIGEAPDPSEENVDHNKLEEQINCLKSVRDYYLHNIGLTRRLLLKQKNSVTRVREYK